MTNTIHHDVYRDDESVSTASEFSQRIDFTDENEWRNSSSSVYSAIGKKFRAWIRSPMPPPGSVQGEPPMGSDLSNVSGPPKIIQGEPPLGSDLSNVSGPPKIIPFEKLAISLYELNKLTGSFGRTSLVGQRLNSRVFHATFSTGESVAVKKLIPGPTQDSDSDFATQLSKVSRLRHDNVVGLLGYCLESNNRILVHEFARMGSLHDILHGRKGVLGSEPGPVLTWNQRVKIACGAARGLEYIHGEGVIHGAISSRNVLIFDDFVSKIADISVTGTVILPWHAARVFGPSYPEDDITDAMTCKEDIYRFGVVLLELLTGSQPGDYKSFMREQSLVTWSARNVEQHIDPRLNSVYPREEVAKLAAVAALCVDCDEYSRPTAEEVVKAIQPLLMLGKTTK